MWWILLISQIHLSEEDAVNRILQNHPLLEVAHLRVAATREDEIKAWSRHLPVISFTGQYRYSNLEITIPQRFPVAVDPNTFRLIYYDTTITFSYRDNYNFTLQTSLMLTGFGKSLYAGWMMRKMVKAQRARARQDTIQLVLNVRRAYQGALLARENLSLTEEMVRIQEAHLQDARERFQAGLIGEGELLRAELALRNAQASQREAEARYAEALNRLKSLLALPDSAEVVLTDSLTPYPLPSSTDSLMALLERRPDFEALAHRIQALEDQRKMHRARFLPTLSAFAFATYQKPYGFENVWGDQEGYGLLLSWSLFEGGGILSDYRKARIQRDILRKTLQFQKIQARNALKSAFQKVQAARDVMEGRHKDVETSRRMMELTHQAYANGLLREVDFQDAAWAYARARFGYLTSVVQYNLAVLELEELVKGGSRQ